MNKNKNLACSKPERFKPNTTSNQRTFILKYYKSILYPQANSETYKKTEHLSIRLTKCPA